MLALKGVTHVKNGIFNTGFRVQPVAVDGVSGDTFQEIMEIHDRCNMPLKHTKQNQSQCSSS